MKKKYEKLLLNDGTEDMILWELANLALKDGLLSKKRSKKFMTDLSNFSVEWK